MCIKKTQKYRAGSAAFDRTNMQGGSKWQKWHIAGFADLQGAFDAVWRKGALNKLHKAGITNNLLSVFSSFLTDRFSRNLVNSHTSDWACTTTSVPQGSLLSPLKFLVFTADIDSRGT